MSRRYDWERLRHTGDFVLVPGVRPSQVSHLAKANVRRRLGPRAVVTTVHVEAVDMTFVALAYAPSVVDLPPTKTEVAQDRRSAADAEAKRKLDEYNLKLSRQAATEKLEAERLQEEAEQRLEDLAEDEVDEDEQMPDVMPPEAE